MTTKELTKVRPDDGSLVWKDLPGKYKWRSSPTGADEKIYIMNHNAEVLVVSSINGEILAFRKIREDYDDQNPFLHCSFRRSIIHSLTKICIALNNDRLHC